MAWFRYSAWLLFIIPGSAVEPFVKAACGPEPGPKTFCAPQAFKVPECHELVGSDQDGRIEVPTGPTSGPVLGPVLGVQFSRRPVTQSSSRLSQQFQFVVFEIVILKASSTDVPVWSVGHQYSTVTGPMMAKLENAEAAGPRGPGPVCG